MNKDNSITIIFTFISITFILLIYNAACSNNMFEYMGSGPEIFIEDNHGEKGIYYDNIKIEPVYRYIDPQTIFD